MKRFDAYKMIGLTDANNKEIMKYLKAEIELQIDSDGRVWTGTGAFATSDTSETSGTYIADAVEVEDGCGVYC